MSETHSVFFGLICAVGSALFNGSFTVPFKARRDKNDESERSSAKAEGLVHPIVFTLYVSTGVFLSSWAVAPFANEAPKISLLGILAGWIFVLGVAASFVAVEFVGIALAQGIWAGSATLFSYAWGVIIFQEAPNSPLMSVLGLFVLVTGVVGMACSNMIGKMSLFARFCSQNPGGKSTLVVESQTLIRTNSKNGENSNYNTTMEVGEELNLPHEPIRSSIYVKGVIWASVVGIFGGSILAPIHYAPADMQGIAVLPSFGIGTVTLAPIVFLVNILLTGVVPPLRIRISLLPGLFSGLLWNISNLLSLVAIPAVGYSVAYPLLQGAVLVSGIWGIYVFKEISNPSTIKAFWCGGVVFILGAITLAISQ
mmetsp:Transcript_21549/g.32721  ORF Transcript_21549/g.32721 Transcript_21549/m.32721 type:complete len:368 (+) Transcript_21549:83-1186(+)